jgi:hypothetical protein
VGNGSGVSRGDRNRNARLARLRELVPVQNAIVGIDLADNKQMVVVCDHDSRVLARRTFRCRAWDLGAVLDWAGERAAAQGFAAATVSCEPTGHRWRILGQLASERSMLFVCVQPSLTAWARRSEDLTFDKTGREGRGADRPTDRAAALLPMGDVHRVQRHRPRFAAARARRLDMTQQPCLTCGALSSRVGSRCPRCQRPRDAAAQQQKRTIRPYTAAERDRRAAAITEWVGTHGWLCPGWRPAHPPPT